MSVGIILLINLLPGNGENTGIQQPLDLFLKFGKPSPGSFLVEEDPLATSFVAEIRKIGTEPKGLETPSASVIAGQSGGLTKISNVETVRPVLDGSLGTLDKLLERQQHAPLPKLYGQKPVDRSRPASDGPLLRQESGESCGRDHAAADSTGRKGKEAGGVVVMALGTAQK